MTFLAIHGVSLYVVMVHYPHDCPVAGRRLGVNRSIHPRQLWMERLGPFYDSSFWGRVESFCATY